MKYPILYGLALLTLILSHSSGCGEADDSQAHQAASGGTCNVTTVSDTQSYVICQEYFGLNAEQKIEVEKICKNTSAGIWSNTTTCPSTGQIGRCSFLAGDISFYYYYYANYTDETASASCISAEGTWTKFTVR